MLTLVIGPPASGKSTWVREQAKPGDIVIDFDALANTITPGDHGHDHLPHIIAVTKAARHAAITEAVKHRKSVGVYIIHSTPSIRLIHKYLYIGAELVIIDPGKETVLKRISNERPVLMQDLANKWYADFYRVTRAFPDYRLISVNS